jgi:hypothetical protein
VGHDSRATSDLVVFDAHGHTLFTLNGNIGKSHHAVLINHCPAAYRGHFQRLFQPPAVDQQRPAGFKTIAVLLPRVFGNSCLDIAARIELERAD